MKVKINDIESYRTPESCQYNIDDRVEKIPLINGNVVQDYGYVPSGDSFTVSALFSWVAFMDIVALWTARQKVTFTDESGAEWEECRIVLKSYKYYPRFHRYVLVDFEIWRV